MAVSYCQVSLLVLLGVLALSSGPVHSIPGRYITTNLKHIHEVITGTLDLKQPAVGSSPLFSPLIRIINSSCQRDQALAMNATLDVYLHIFSSIQTQTQTRTQTQTQTLLDQLDSQSRSRVLSALRKLQHAVVEVKKHLEREDKLRTVLNTLDNIQVEDLLVQKKALAEFLQVYQAASVISNKQ